MIDKDKFTSSLVIYFSTKLNINEIANSSTNDIHTINLYYDPKNRIFGAKLFLIHRLTLKENVKEIIERNIKCFTNIVKRKLGFEKPDKIYKQDMNTVDATNYSEVVLVYSLTEEIEDALFVLTKIK